MAPNVRHWWEFFGSFAPKMARSKQRNFDEAFAPLGITTQHKECVLTMALSSKAPFIGLSLVLSTALLVVITSKPKKKLSRSKLTLTALLWRNSFWIQNIRVPIANLPESSQDTAKVDDEGLVDCDIRIEAGKIAEFNMSPPSKSTKWRAANGQGCIFLPCFVDAHTHIVKTQTVPRNRNYTGTMGEALAVEAADQPNWRNVEHVTRLMDFALQCAQHYGTKALRTHLDGCASDDPNVTEAVYQAYSTIVTKYAKQGITLQGVANLWLPLWLEEPFATHHANQAAKHPNIVLGAYVGNPSPSEKPQTVAAMKALFEHAHRLSLDVDMHIDESNDPSCCSLLSLVEALRDARDTLNYKGRVVLGHCCALSLQDEETQTHICQQLADLKAFVVANPTTNLGLQDRRGSSRPHSLPIPVDIPRTPQWRGLTLVQELEANGVSVCMASDNVRDHWHSYGDFDLLAVWMHGLLLGHLDTAPSAGAWTHLVTQAPSEAMGLDGGSCWEVGEAADGIFFPQARRFSELLARPQTDRIVMRNGRIQTTQLPGFQELDDLVSTPTSRPPPESFFEQSAT